MADNPGRQAAQDYRLITKILSFSFIKRMVPQLVEANRPIFQAMK
jgi:hypothetical protein